MNVTSAQASGQYCVFSVRQETFAVDATDVREIVEMAPIVSVPHAPSCLAGLCHVRNEFVPVLLLSPFTSDSSTDLGGLSLLLLIDGPHGVWALAISQVIGLERLGQTAFEREHSSTQPNVVTGSTRWRERVVRILDMDALALEAASSVEHAWTLVSNTTNPSNHLAVNCGRQTAS
ncbi:MAG: chemotaxis protein CheW [Planctomycetaceae bacterium]|nr:chemotaxis protein CheW [Planctomycetaceae bacterium]